MSDDTSAGCGLSVTQWPSGLSDWSMGRHCYRAAGHRGPHLTQADWQAMVAELADESSASSLEGTEKP